MKFVAASTQYLTVPTSSFLTPTNTYTIEMWLNPTSYPGAGVSAVLYHVSNATVSNFGALVLTFFGSGTIRLDVRPSTNGTNIQINSASVIPLNTWTHVAVVVNAGAATIYLNGVSSATGSVVVMDGTQTFCSIGRLNNGYTTNQTYYNGLISNFRILKNVAQYTAAFSPPTDNLSAISGTSLLLTGATIADSSGNSLSITNNGTTITIMENPFGDYSTYFPSGAGSNYVVPHSSSLDFDTGDFTVEFWMYATNIVNTSGIIGKKASDVTNGWQIYYNSTYANKMSIRLSLTNDFTSTSTWTLNTWEHWAVTRSGTTVRWFKNGVLDATGTNSSNIAENRSVYIGYSETWGGYFTGYLSNIRVVKGSAVYTATFTPPTSALTAISGTSLLTCQYSEIMDASTNHALITAVVPRPNNQNPFGNYYASFNGTSQYISVPYNANQAFGANNFTIESWVYITDISKQGYIISAWYGVGGQFYIIVNSSGRLVFRYVTGSTTQVTVTATTTSITANAWYHIAVVRNGTTITLYVNGVADSTTSNIGSTALVYYNGTQKDIYLGRDGTTAANYFAGYITNARIVIGTAVYTGNFTPPATPLAATQSSGTNISAITGTSTTLLTCQYADIVDASTNKSTITNGGSVLTYLTDVFSSIVSGVNYSQKNYSLKFIPASSAVTTVTATQPAALSGDFTVECWFYMDYSLGSPPTMSGSISGTGATVGGAFTIAGNGASNAAGWCINLYLDGISWVRPGSATNFQFIPSGGTYGSRYFQDNTWYHLAICRSGTTWTCYINGVLATNRTAANYSITTTALTIGGIFSQTQWNFWGYISNFRIVNGLAVYTGAFTPPTSPLRISQSSGTNIAAITTQTQILTAQYNTLFDASTNKLALTKVGTPDMVNVYPFPA